MFGGGTDGFDPKAPHGPLSHYCRHCGERVEAHATVWINAMGSLRQCPTEAREQYEAHVAEQEREVEAKLEQERELEERMHPLSHPNSHYHHSPYDYSQLCSADGGSPTPGAMSTHSATPSRRFVDPPFGTDDVPPPPPSARRCKKSVDRHPSGLVDHMSGPCQVDREDTNIKPRPTPHQKSNSSKLIGAGLREVIDDGPKIVKRHGPYRHAGDNTSHYKGAACLPTS